MPSPLVQRRCLIEGRVQMVGFRMFTVEAARRLGVSGWVRNREDGAVEAVLQGEAEAVERCLQELRRGPAAAEVLGVSVVSEEALPPLEGFRAFP